MILDETKAGSAVSTRQVGVGARKSVPARELPKKVSGQPDSVTDLQALASEIRSDAVQDPVFYLLRSNTSHDGE